MDTAYASIDELQAQVAAGESSYVQITSDALLRIQQLDDEAPKLNAILETVPAALEQARKLSAHAPGLLQGIPFVVKANIDTAGPTHTHAGSAAIGERIAANNAQLVTALQREGAILVGTSNLSEWANFRARRSVSGWSSVGGQTRNPHVLDRNPCGSSSGSAVAVAAGMVPLAIGTETHGSIVCPAGVNGIVGLKPTLGLVSRDGIIPIAASQDTAGPMARSVKEVALALQAMAQPDPRDDYAKDHPGRVDYVGALDTLELPTVRVGVWRAYTGAEENPRVTAILENAVGLLEAAGVGLVDPVGLYLDREIFASSYQVMLHEFRQGFTDFFSAAYTLQGVMAFNEENAEQIMPWFGQDNLAAAQATVLTPAEHQAALDAGQGEMRRLVDAVFAKFQLDALIAPTNDPAWPIDFVAGDRFGVSSAGPAAISGRPAVTIPAGQIHGLPIGVTLIGEMWGDRELLRIAYGLEQLLPPAPRPQFVPSLEVDPPLHKGDAYK